jgi:hypothetical protein
MNKDLDPHFLPDGQYRDALNIIVGDSDGQYVAIEGSNNGAAQNYLGNTLMNSALGLTNAKCIGSLAYDASNLIYWLVAADNADAIYEYNEALDLTTIVLKATKATPTTPSLLNFNKTFYVTGINYINGLLFWTDNYNPPRRINIERAKNYGVDNFTEDDISVILAPPLDAPAIELSNTGDSNNLEDKFLYFAYRYKYIDNEYSALSPFSPVAFFPKQFAYDYGVSENISMTNYFNTVTLTYDRGGDNVIEVQLVYKDTRSLNAYIIDNIQTRTLSSSQSQTYQFKNNKVYSILDADQVNRLFDNVPLKAKSQELIGSRLIYGNYTQFFNLVNCIGEPINPVFNLSLTDEIISDNIPKPTFKSNRDYEIGLVYLDDYGRSTTVVIPEGDNTTDLTNTIFIPAENANVANNIRVTIDKNFEPPCFATYYRFYIKQNKQDYYNVFPLTYFTEGQFKWFLINQADVDKISVGSYVYLKNSSNVSKDVQFKILDIESKSANFLDNDNIQPAGVYFKVKISSSVLPDVFTYYGYGSRTGSTDPVTGDFQVAEETIFYGVGLNNLETSNGNIYSTTIPSGKPNVDARFYVEINGSGTPDTYRYYVMFGGSGKKLVASGINIVAGVDAVLTYTGPVESLTIYGNYTVTISCTVRFDTSTGHTTGDYWVVNCRASFGTFTGPINIFGGIAILSTSTWAAVYVTTQSWTLSSLTSSVRPVYPGAILKFAVQYGSTGTKLEKQFISSAYYANIEEWFIEDNAYINFSILDNGSKDVNFRRIQNLPVNTSSQTGTQGGSISGDSLVYPMAMFIGPDFNTTAPDYFFASLNVVQQSISTVFETVPVDFNQDVYYELSDTFAIIDGVHTGNYQNQILPDPDVIPPVTGQSAIVDLNTFTQNSNFNAFAWGNNVESYRIRDDYNAATMEFSPRANSTIEGYEQQTLVQALTYSGVYQQTTALNRLNEFNLSLGNFKYLDRFFGSIQKLYARDTDLVVFQENKISKVLYGKNLLSDSTGGGTIASIPEVLGTQIAYLGEYGISNNPESFAIWGNDLFFTDTRRAAVLKLAENGLFEISSDGMKNWFKANLDNNTQKLGIFDPYFEHYVLSNNDVSVNYCVFDVNEQDVDFAKEAKTNVYAFTVDSNNEWYITVPTNDWLTLSTLYGNDTTLIYYSATANTGNIRNLTVTVQGCGGTRNIIFNQASGVTTTTTTTTSGPTTTTTTTTGGPTTTTTTTTQIPVWYRLISCINGDIVNSISYPVDSFSIGDIVEFGGAYFTVDLQLFSNPGGPLIPITSTVFTSCPPPTTTTTTTTHAPYVLEVAPCGGGTNYFITLASGLSYPVGFALVLQKTGVPAFPGNICYEVLNADSPTTPDYLAVNVVGESLSCASCVPPTTTTTTTTTLPPVWYQMTACSNGDTVNSQQYTLGSFSVGQIVEFGGAYFTIVSELYANPGGSQIPITLTGLTSCPATTTTTTTTTHAPYVLEVAPCGGGTNYFITLSSGLSYPVGFALVLEKTGVPAFPGNICYEVLNADSAATPDYLAVNVVSQSLSCASCVPATTTTTTTTTLAPVWYRTTSCADGSTVYTTQRTIGTFAINDRLTFGGAFFVVAQELTTNPGGSQIEMTGTGLTGCPATTTTTTTTTLPPMSFTYSTSCAGGEGTGVITINSISGGTGTGYQYSIQPTPGTWFNYPATNQLTGLGNGTYTVAARDSVGNGTSTPGISISCITPTTTTTTLAPTTTTTTCTPNGTLLSTFCSGFDLIGVYANGSCGTYNSVIQFNSPSCGYVTPTTTTTCTPNGTLLSTYCSGVNLVGVYANGSCGTFDSIIEYNSPSCGYVPPTTTTTCTPSGTLLSTFCSGFDLIGVYANGSCGTYNSPIEFNSPSCGYVAPTTTTAAPTTTTTTVPPAACYTYNWVCDNGFGAPCDLSWTNCDGSPGSDFVSDGSGGSVCAQVDTFGIGNGSWTQGGSC